MTNSKPTYQELEQRIKKAERDLINTKKILHECEGRLSAIDQNWPMLFCSFLPGCRITFANNAYCEYFKKTSDDIIGSNFLSYIADIDHDVVKSNISLLTPQLPMQSHDHRIIGPDGKIHWLQWTIQGIFDDQGHAVMYLAIGIDITEQKQIETELRKQVNFTQSLLNAIPTPVFFKDLVGKYLGCNRAFSELMGVSSDEIKGKTVKELWPSQHAEVYHQKDLAIINDPEHQVYDFEIRDKDGTTRPVIFAKDVFRDGEGVVTGMVGAFLDISERKLVEKELQESEERFRTLFNQANDAIFLHDFEGRFHVVNVKACKSLGYSSVELLNMGVRDVDLDFLEREYSNEFWNSLPAVFEGRHRRKDGTIIHVEVRLSEVIIRDQRLVLSIVSDISDRKHQEEEKKKISDQLLQAQKLESIGKLAGGVSHDLNNLLSPIIGYGELLLSDLDLSEKNREWVKQILGAGYRSRDLVKQLLAFSRKQTLEYKPTNLNVVLEKFEKLLRRTIREDINIVFVASPDIPIIMADVGQIEQVVMNLAVNSQDAMPEGGILKLETAIDELDENYTKNHPGTQPGRYVLLIVSDTGNGINEEIQKHIFEPFYSTKGNEGTGLGLATVYGIIKQHEGNIWVYSEEGMGTTFKIYLPLSEKLSKIDRIETTPTYNYTGTETVLIAEDNEQVLLLVTEILTRQGYTILAAKNGIVAMDTLDKCGGSVDLLLTDVVMPQINGKELYSKAVARYPNLKVLYMSGYTDDIINHHGILEKGMPFIQKPFSNESLAEMVRKILDNPKT